ncbi:MAG: hypothetical protein Q4F65_11225 [Propionibacteriaceae bacterium]|nr:hypothetical protein [Propionibacteriaceae bacterium]
MTAQPMPDAVCPCGRPVSRRGLCVTCYRRAREQRSISFTPHRDHADVVEDVEWMLTAGETHPEAIARRLGYAGPDSLYKALHRADRGDLVDQLTRKGRP